MGLSIGIVGLPNVGKSTLFNALLKKQQALVANYPFATIEPNVGVVAVPDDRLEKIAEITAREIASPQNDKEDSGQARMTDKSKWPPIKPATVKFVDIAGLVKGANEGAGLGNKFLSHIREVSIIAHVVRAFTDENIIKAGSVDPISDYQTIETELLLADLQTVTNAQSKIKRFQNEDEKNALAKLIKVLNEGKPARDIQLTEEEQVFARQLFLLSSKPELVVLNVSEEDCNEKNIEPIVNHYTSILVVPRENVVVICAKIESELASLSPEEQKEYLEQLGLKQSGLEQLIQKAYATLNLISFLTAGEKEVRAWTISKNSKAVDAAGTIHTDFSKKFIKAEVVSYQDFIANNGWKGSREHGKARLEGKEYSMKDGDVVEFKIGS